MYSSLYGNGSFKHKPDTSQKGGKVRSKVSTHSDPLSIGGLSVNIQPLLEHNAKLLNGKITVRD